MNNKKKISYILTISALSTLGVCIYNKIEFLLTTSKEHLFSNNSNFYSWRFGKVFYTVKGSGSPILLIHDLSSSSSGYEWKNIIDDLSKNHTVYTIDLIGCGRSDKPKMTYTNYLYVQLFTDFIKNVIKRKTSIIATGLSTTAAIMTCYIEPQLFDNIILVNPLNMAITNKCPSTKDRLIKWIIETPVIGTFIYNIAMSKYTLSNQFNSKLFFDSSKITKKHISTYCESAHLGGYAAKYLYSSILCKYTNTNICHALKDINNNIQLIMGEHEPQKDVSIQSYTDLNSSIEFEVITNTKHLPQIENPEKFVECCEIYLQ